MVSSLQEDDCKSATKCFHVILLNFMYQANVSEKLVRDWAARFSARIAGINAMLSVVMK
jgi:hypothetical protein